MLDAKEFYVIEALAMEWRYVIERTIILPTEGVTPDDAVMSLEMPYPVYYLSRARFPAKLLAEKFGTTEEFIENSKIIRLEPYEVSGDLPSPNVNEIGTA